jgi:hypothetical protein
MAAGPHHVTMIPMNLAGRSLSKLAGQTIVVVNQVKVARQDLFGPIRYLNLANDKYQPERKLGRQLQRHALIQTANWNVHDVYRHYNQLSRLSLTADHWFALSAQCFAMRATVLPGYGVKPSERFERHYREGPVKSNAL